MKISTSFPKWPLARQTPGASGAWDGIQFLVDQEVEECDAWFVYDGLTEEETTICPPENIFFVAAEPPPIKTYKPKWLRQFAGALSFRSDLAKVKIHLSQTALPWHIGKSFDELADAGLPVKTKGVSVIASNKDFTHGHRNRLAFIRQLRGPIRADIFGRGVRDLPVKWDGLAPYRYSVAIENCSLRDYWTEKIADCFLAGAVPFYYGCPNILDYFPVDSFVWVDVEKPEAALKAMEATISEADYARRRPALLKAKELVLKKYNLFSVLAEFCRNVNIEARRRKVRLRPEAG